MDELEQFGSTFLGRLLDQKAKRKKKSADLQSMINDCICTGSGQAIGCPAYPEKNCIWHPENDPYDQKNRHWINGQFVKKVIS